MTDTHEHYYTISILPNEEWDYPSDRGNPTHDRILDEISPDLSQHGLHFSPPNLLSKERYARIRDLLNRHGLPHHESQDRGIGHKHRTHIGSWTPNTRDAELY